MNAHAPLGFSYRLIVSQGLNAFGDHCAKITISGLIAALFPERQAALFVGVVSALYVLPYILLAPIAGRMSSRFSKKAIVRGSLLLQTGAMALMAASAAMRSFSGVMVALTLVACQSSFLAPSRNALLKDLCGNARIGQMMGLLGLAGVGATLAGLAIGGWSFDAVWSVVGSPWTAMSLVSVVSAVLAFLSFVVVGGIRDEEETKREEEVRFLTVLGEVMRRPGLRWASLGLAWFYGVGAMLVMILLQDSRWEHGRQVGSASEGGAMAAFLGLGVAMGSGLAAYLCRKRVEVGLSFLAALLLAALTPVTALVWEDKVAATLGVFAMGLAGGLFSAPLNALFVSIARDEARVGSIAANNLIINSMSALFVGAASLMGFLGWSPQSQLWIVSATAVAVVGVMTWLIPESLLRMVLLAATKILYPMKVRGIAKMPTEGGVLLVANHVSYADALLLTVASPRPIRFMGTGEMLRYPWMRWAYRKFNVIAVSPAKAKDAIRNTVEALEAGDVVCVFPEGALTRTGMTMPFKKGVELMARRSGARVLPAYIDGMWGSVFSFAGTPFRYRKGIPWRRRVEVRFGDGIEAQEATVERLQEQVAALGCVCFANRDALKGSVGRALFKSLRTQPLAVRLVDRGLGRAARFRGYALAALGLRISACLRDVTSTRRIGILLPPGLPGFAVNFGALWAGRSCMNLNPTVSEESFRMMLGSSGVDTVITSRRLTNRFPGLDFGACKVVYVEDWLPRLRGARMWWDAALFLALPTRWSEKVFGLNPLGGDAEAALLYSSGSSAEPKGIPLSHRNLLANVVQLREIYLMEESDTVLSCLPLFHSFGLTGGFLMPMLKGIQIVATPSPLAAKENVAAIKEESVTVALGTPTFLRGYFRVATRQDLASLRFAIAGGEKLPVSLAREWSERFGAPVLEGYGLTECAPVIALNCLQSERLKGRYAIGQFGAKRGTVGRVLPGINVRIVEEDDWGSGKRGGECGLILVKGANVFRGYLDQGGEGRFVGDGWFNTGDIGRIDEDGCLSIEGRLSRFSKIGGEMVSHEAIERATLAACSGAEGGSDFRIFVGSCRCARKGEALVVLSTQPLSVAELAQRLRARGFPNLWIPQWFRQVEELPTLGTGKLDLKACQSLCQEAVNTAGAA